MGRGRNLPRAGLLAALLVGTSAAPLAQTPALAPSAAEVPVSLIADEVAVDAEAGTVTATGNVEVLYGDRVLRASRIVYSDTEETISAEGPLLLTDPQFGVVEAGGAALNADLTEGLIASARLLLAGEMQIAAAEIRRTEGRYTILHDTIASTCEICAEGDSPTWAIRAERIVRDELEEQIYLRNATLEVFGLPVLWLPYLRIPDPSSERASGLLAPVFRRSEIYGTGVKLPYYFVLGPSADATLTPFVTTRGGILVEGEYRRRFRRGAIDLFGVVLPDDRLDDRSFRGAASAEGFYDLGQGFRAELDAEVVSDDAFLEQFDYPDEDRLTSTLQVVRTRARDYFRLGAVAFQSLRPEENTDEVPLILPELRYRRLWWDALAGGRIGVDAEGVGILREGGRDVLRFGGGADWRRDWVFGPGLVAAASTGADLDVFHIRGESGDPGERNEVRGVPFASAELRWPLARTGEWGVHVVEPIAELAWSEDLGGGVLPNEDSQLPEFDETNLFALDRFPGRDRIETGLRANLGLRYALFGAAGRSLQATFGRVLRFSDEDQFAAGTGLSGSTSDWVGAIEVALGNRLLAINRIRFDGFDISRNEFSVLYDSVRAGLRASWVFLDDDALSPGLGAQPQTSELAFDARYRFLPNWQVAAAWRYDAATDSTIRAGAGLTYGNECAEIDLTVSRRFVSAGDVPPSTSVGFVVRLAGLGASEGADWPTRACNG